VTACGGGCDGHAAVRAAAVHIFVGEEDLGARGGVGAETGTKQNRILLAASIAGRCCIYPASCPSGLDGQHVAYHKVEDVRKRIRQPIVTSVCYTHEALLSSSC
jgi:hypothetical protein